MPTPPRQIDVQENPDWVDWKWKTLVALPILLVTTLLGYYAAWGLLFFYWAYGSLRRGEAFLVEPVSRARNPALFWAIAALWVVFAGLYILADFYPDYA